MRAPVNLGLLGCGRVAELMYAPALSRSPGIRLVAVADPRPERARLIASRFSSCAALASAENLLARGDLHAVVVATPPPTHAALAVAAVRAGLPVLVEKPLVPSAAGPEALDPFAALPAAGACIAMAFNRRCWEPVERLRKAIRRRPPDAWRVRLVTRTDLEAWSTVGGGGTDLLDDLGSHQIDLLRYLFGSEVRSVEAWWSGPTAFDMRIRLANGVVAECLAAHGAVSRESVTVAGDGRSYRVDTALGSRRIRPAAGPARHALDLCDAVRRRVRREPSPMRRSFDRQLGRFVEQVRSGAPPVSDLADGIATVCALAAARRSAAMNGREVNL